MNNDQKKCPVTHLTTDFGAPVVDNQNSMTAGARGPLLAQDLWLNEKLANFVREVIPERRMHAKGSGAFGTFTVTHDITQYSCAKIFSEIGKQTPMFARFTTVAGERGAADDVYAGIGLQYTGPRPTTPLITPKHTGQILNEDDTQQ